MQSISTPIFQIKKGSLVNLGGRKDTQFGPHLPVPTFPLSTPPPPSVGLGLQNQELKILFQLDIQLLRYYMLIILRK